MTGELFLIMLIMFVSALIAVCAFVAIYRAETRKKLKRHIEEWERRKADCIKKIDPVILAFQPNVARCIVKDEYNSYTNELFHTELNTFAGCCFPPLGKIEW